VNRNESERDLGIGISFKGMLAGTSFLELGFTY
jgi:hypothetical protein